MKLTAHKMEAPSVEGYPTYITYNLTHSSRFDLDTFMSDYVQGVVADEYHMTVCYSQTPIGLEDLSVPLTAVATPVAYELFDTKTGEKCLVLRVECETAVQFNAMLVHRGATSTYDSYKPHITLAYPYSGEIPDKLPPFNIEFYGIQCKELDTEYRPKSK